MSSEFDTVFTILLLLLRGWEGRTCNQARKCSLPEYIEGGGGLSHSFTRRKRDSSCKVGREVGQIWSSFYIGKVPTNVRRHWMKTRPEKKMQHLKSPHYGCEHSVNTKVDTEEATLKKSSVRSRIFDEYKG